MTLTAGNVVFHINQLVGSLVELGVANDQNVAVLKRRRGGVVDVTFEGAQHVSTALKNRSYRDAYYALLGDRSFVVRLLDGALLQLMYRFVSDEIIEHRLAFLPSPDLEEFQREPEIYLEDQLYAEVVARSLVPFPLRFDFKAQPSTGAQFAHPKSHLTLGQYRNCRIPVSSPVSPGRFMDFVLRNFYHSGFLTFTDRLPALRGTFGLCIETSEQQLVHVVIPSS